jgi:hypothetical protein
MARFYVRAPRLPPTRQGNLNSDWQKNEVPALQLRTPRRAKYPLLRSINSAMLGEPSPIRVPSSTRRTGLFPQISLVKYYSNSHFESEVFRNESLATILGRILEKYYV